MNAGGVARSPSEARAVKGERGGVVRNARFFSACEETFFLVPSTVNSTEL